MILRKGKIIEFTSIDGKRIQYGVVVSNNSCLKYSPVFQVCPLQEQDGKYIPEPKKELIVEKEQILTIIGTLNNWQISVIEEGIIEHHNAEPNGKFKAGEIWFCNIPKEDGSIQYGCRPVMISSSEIVEGKIHVIPFTSKMKKLEQPTHVLLSKEESHLELDSLLLAEAEMPVNTDTFTIKVGEITLETWEQVLNAIKIQRGIM